MNTTPAVSVNHNHRFHTVAVPIHPERKFTLLERPEFIVDKNPGYVRRDSPFEYFSSDGDGLFGCIGYILFFFLNDSERMAGYFRINISFLSLNVLTFSSIRSQVRGRCMTILPFS